MARHKDTYTAKLNTDRQPTIDSQGEVRFRVEIQRGDPGRPVDLGLTEEELDWALKAAREVRLLHATEQVRAEEQHRGLNLQFRVWSLERQEKDLE